MSHEDLTREHRVDGSSDRSFGIVFAVVFAVIGAWPILSAAAPRWWAFAIAVLIGLIALLRPALLAWPNRQWGRLGIVLGRVVSPIALGVLFYGVFTPGGILMRLAGKDPLGLRRDTRAESYWRPRVPPGPPPDSMTNQF
jgi:hypothetical protein